MTRAKGEGWNRKGDRPNIGGLMDGSVSFWEAVRRGRREGKGGGVWCYGKRGVAIKARPAGEKKTAPRRQQGGGKTAKKLGEKQSRISKTQGGTKGGGLSFRPLRKEPKEKKTNGSECPPEARGRALCPGRTGGITLVQTKSKT